MLKTNLIIRPTSKVQFIEKKIHTLKVLRLTESRLIEKIIWIREILMVKLSRSQNWYHPVTRTEPTK